MVQIMFPVTKLSVLCILVRHVVDGQNVAFTGLWTSNETVWRR